MNMGWLDRLLRLAVGVALIAYAVPVWFEPSGWNWLGWIGVVPLLTAIFGTCPLYSALGVSSRHSDRPA